jgi:hypothetical protein
MKNSDVYGGDWAAMSLCNAVLKKDELQAIESINLLSVLYTQEEIKKIWKRIKLLLSEIDEKWIINILIKMQYENY